MKELINIFKKIINLIKLNNITDKKNFRIVETGSKYRFEKYVLQFNYYKNFWTNVSDLDKDSKFFNIINTIYLSYFYVLNTLLMLIFPNTINLTIITIGFFHLLIYFVMRDSLKYSNLRDYKSDLNRICNITKKNKKIVLKFNKNGDEITGEKLNRINKLNNLI